MSGLVEKLEAAEVGSRELDARIWCANNGITFKKMIAVKGLPDRHYSFRTSVGDVGLHGLSGHPPISPVTTSLDAALALVPERVFWSLKGPHFGVFKAAIYSRQTPFRGVGRTAPLAVCISALKAHEARALNLNETRHD